MHKTLLLLTILTTLSCGGPRFMASSVAPSDISALSYLDPYTYIQLIEKGNQSSLNDSLSQISGSVIDSLLLANQRQLHLTNKLEVDSALKSQVEREVNYLAQSIIYSRKLDGIVLTPTIDSLMESSQQRFTLAIIATGFGRRRGNFGGQVAKGAAIGILTLGMYAPVPIKSTIELHALIFDAQLNEVAYYKRALPIQKEPTDPQAIGAQLDELFSGYFYPTK